jgi:hypothetical protein
MPGNTRVSQTSFRLLSKALQILYVVLCALFLSPVVGAQEARIITFDAPNSGTLPYIGTQATGINFFGTVTGNVTDNNFGTHGFVRTPDGKFTNFDAPVPIPS